MLRLIANGIEVGDVLASEQGRYVQCCAWERNTMIQAFWKAARTNFVEVNLLRAEHLYADLGYTGTMSREARENLSRVVGTVTRMDLLALSVACRRGAKQIIPPPELAELLAVPFYDLPGRIVGFLAVGQTDGKTPRLVQVYTPLTRQTEAGCGNLGVWHQPPIPGLDDVIFLLNDVRLFLRLHSRHTRSASRQLPAVLSLRSQGGSTERIHPSLPRRPIIALGHVDDTVDLLRLAYMAGGVIAQHYKLLPTSCADPQQFLKQMQSHIAPWEIRLQHLLSTADPVQITSIFNDIGVSHEDTVRFMEKCPQQLRERLAKLGIANIADRTVEIAGQRVRCTSHGWFVGKRQVADVDIRFDKRVFLKTGRILYTGSIIRDTQVWPFRFVDRQNNGLFRRITMFLQARGVAVNLHRSWAPYAMQTAIAGHQPTEHRNIDQVGWDDEAGIFRLPKFTVGIGGQVQLDAVTAFPVKPPTPAMTIPAPGLSCGQDFVEIRQQTAAQLFWAIAGAILQNVVAPALNLKPAGIVLTGEGRNSTGRRIVEGLGCPAIERSGKPTRKQLQHWLEYHRWPLLVDLSCRTADRRKHMLEWLEADNSKNAVILADDVTACALATRGWLVLDCDRGLTFTAAAIEAGRRLVSHYLHDLCTRHGKTHTPMQCARETILIDLSYWHRNLTGSALQLEHVRRQSQYGEHQPIWFSFLDLLSRLVPSSTALLSMNPDSVWVSYPELVRLLLRRKSPMIDAEAITRELFAVGVLLSNYDVDGKYGWLIAKPWWEAHYKKHRSLRGTPYRLPVED